MSANSFILIIILMICFDGASFAVHRSKRGQILFESKETRWPDKTIPYEFSSISPLTPLVKQRFYQAIKHWEHLTCIRFELFDPQRHKTYLTKLLVANRGTGCASDVGYIVANVSENNMYLTDICTTGIVVHELGHAIGFRHEQNRPDRDKYIEINDKIMKLDPTHPERMNFNVFKDLEPTNYGVPYDLNSIMHYSDYKIKSLDSRLSFLMGQRDHLSFLDRKLANKAYKCAESCGGIEGECQNEGFLIKNCTCVCPEGLTGQFCEELVYFSKTDSDSIDMTRFRNGDLDCQFTEESLCRWRVDEVRSFNKIWNFSPPSVEKGQRLYSSVNDLINQKKSGVEDLKYLKRPRKNLKTGSYIYLSPLTENRTRTSILTTPKIVTSSAVMLRIKFWYILFEVNNHAITHANLSVNILLSNGTVLRMWGLEGSQGPKWKYANIELQMPEMSELAVFIEATVGDLWQNLIAIDGLVVEKVGLDRWSEWSEWSRCVGTCRSGIRYRTRICLNRAVKACLGNSSEYEPCPNSCRKVRETGSDSLPMEAILKPCGAIYELFSSGMTFITSPDYLNQYDRGLECFYLVKADPGMKIVATVNELDIQKYDATGGCIDSLEFRYFSLGQPGPRYCGQIDALKIESESSVMMIIFRSNWVQARKANGFLINVFVQ